MRFRPLLIPSALLCLVAAGIGAQEEPEPVAVPAALPPVKVRLTALGSPSRITLTAAGGLRVTLGEAGEATAAGEKLVLAASGKQVVWGDKKSATFRVEAEALAVEAGKAKRVYPGALLVSASGGRLSLANECDLDRYTEGVLCGECPALFHPEAIRAMAIAARSYSYRKAFLGKNDLCDTTHCQVYKGIGSVAASIKEAVAATRGLCALYDGEVIDAVYSSDCGGYTEANENAWKGARPLPYLRPVEDAPEPQGEPYCAVNRSHRWKVTLTPERLRTLFGRSHPELRLEVADLTESGRVRLLHLGPAGTVAPAADPAETPNATMSGMLKLPAMSDSALLKRFSGEQWRRMLGLSVVKSLKFEVREGEKGVELEGRGYGHGVGLCQFGANGMGRQGLPFEEIIRHYYSGTEVAPAPSVAEARARLTRPRVASRTGIGE